MEIKEIIKEVTKEYIVENYNNKHYYTTSYPMSIKDFIKLEVKERDNYDIDEVKEWIKKYNIGKNDKLLWVALEPHIAARYQMNSEDWDNAKQIYNLNPNEFDVQIINANDGFLITETDDGDGGFIFVFR